eukprot:464443-Alexandrium_andersonii.AAC.1
MAACPQAGPKTRASADGQRRSSRCSMVMRAGRARMRTPAGAGTHPARRWDHWKPGGHMRGAGPSPSGRPA